MGKPPDALYVASLKSCGIVCDDAAAAGSGAVVADGLGKIEVVAAGGGSEGAAASCPDASCRPRRSRKAEIAAAGSAWVAVVAAVGSGFETRTAGFRVLLLVVVGLMSKLHEPLGALRSLSSSQSAT